MTVNIGKSVPRRDLPGKLTGEAKYAADVQLPGMLVGKILRSPHPHAKILSIDATGAEGMDGVHAVTTPFDVPGGNIAPDLPILDTEVRFVGDEIAAVAADDEDLAQEAIARIAVDYEILPFVTDMREALNPDSTPVHEGGNLVGGKPITLGRGNVEEGFAEADVIVEDTFTTPAHSGAALEPRAAVALWEGDRLTVWKSTRGAHADRLMLSIALGMELDDVRVIGVNMGAGYGNKDETRLSVLAAVLAQRAGRPVKIEATREEEFIAGRHRHATITTVKMGVKNDGTVTAVHATTIMDTGAYLSSGPGVVRRAGQGALYLYRCPNVRYDGYLTYTNTPSGGSYRALGAPQGHFALEVIADHAAETIGMDLVEFRLMNHVGPEGQPGERITPVNEIMDTQPVEGGVPFSSNGLRECIEKGAEAFGWTEELPQSAEPLRRGKGMAIFIYRGGAGGRSIARMRLERDGALRLESGVMDVGEGSYTVLTQIAAEALGVDYGVIETTFGDSATTPDSPITAGSTVTFSAGLAVKEAASGMRERLLEAGSEALGLPAAELALSDAGVVHSSGVAASFAELASRAGGIEHEATVSPGSTDYIVNSFGAHFAEVEVNTDTGQVTVIRYVAAHDSGRILNPMLAVNQVEGGVSQMLGFALSEQMLTDHNNGVTLNASFLEHKSPTILEYPDIQVIFADTVDPVGPYGAKALGEPPSIGVAPAVANAIRNALGIEVRELPATPDRILDLLAEKEEGGKQ
ncbi:MAG: molybdopterin-dependent oxidoreductase [Dehalococcoidia bacterium]|nr:molybdopterin-dependent oxidoreductase [Dehalococcoidia bacterium]